MAYFIDTLPPPNISAGYRSFYIEVLNFPSNLYEVTFQYKLGEGPTTFNGSWIDLVTLHDGIYYYQHTNVKVNPQTYYLYRYKLVVGPFSDPAQTYIGSDWSEPAYAGPVNTGMVLQNQAATPTDSSYVYQNKVNTFRPVAYWRLNEPAGPTAWDVSTPVYNGIYRTTTGSISYGNLGAIKGDSDTAIRLTPDAWVDAAYVRPFSNVGPTTLIAWLKVSAGTEGGVIFSGTNLSTPRTPLQAATPVLKTISSGSNLTGFSFTTGNTGGTVTWNYTIPLNEYIKVSLVTDVSAGYHQLFVNDIDLGKQAGAGTFATPDNIALEAGRGWTGYIDEVSAFPQALSISSVQGIYSAGAKGLVGEAIETSRIDPKVRMDSTGIFATDSAGTRIFYLDAIKGDVTADKGTFTGAAFQTSRSAAKLILNSEGLFSYKVDGSTPFYVTKSGDAFMADVTAAQFKTGALPANLVLNSAGLFSYVNSASTPFSLTAAGVLNLTGTITASTITGGTITGTTIVGSAFKTTDNSLILDHRGLAFYFGSSTPFFIDRASGSVTGSGTFTGAQFRTGPAPPHIVLNSEGLFAYASSTSTPFALTKVGDLTLDGTLNTVTINHTVVNVSTINQTEIIGSVYRTTGREIALDNRGLVFYSGTTTPVFIDRVTGTLTTTGPIISGGTVTGTEITASTFRVKDRKLDTRALSFGPTIYLPLNATYGLIDQSGSGNNGTGNGGIVVGTSSGPWLDETATDFDGTDDTITTTYKTRRNEVVNPSIETNATNHSTFGTNTVAQSAVQAQFGTQSLKATYNNDVRLDGIGASTNVLANNYVVLSVGVWIPTNWDGGAINIGDDGTLGGSTTIDTNRQTANMGLRDQWQQISVVLRNDAVADDVSMFIRTVSAATAGRFIYIDAFFCEQSSSLLANQPTYFDGSTHGNSTGWLGTTHASASDKGCFANGTTRTFVGWAQRDTSTTDDTLFGSTGAASALDCRLHLGSGGNNVSFTPNVGLTGVTWTGAWPGNSLWTHWALIFNETSDTAELFINGVSKGAQVLTVPYQASTSIEIGAYSGTGLPFDGKMAHVTVYERGLSVSEIADLYAVKTNSPASSVFDNRGLAFFSGASTPLLIEQSTGNITAAQGKFTGAQFQTAEGNVSKLVLSGEGLYSYATPATSIETATPFSLSKTGSFTAVGGTITGSVFQTSSNASVNRVLINSTGLSLYGTAGMLLVQLPTVGDPLFQGKITATKGIDLTAASTPTLSTPRGSIASNKIRWLDATGGELLSIYSTKSGYDGTLSTATPAAIRVSSITQSSYTDLVKATSGAIHYWKLNSTIADVNYINAPYTITKFLGGVVGTVDVSLTNAIPSYAGGSAVRLQRNTVASGSASMTGPLVSATPTSLSLETWHTQPTIEAGGTQPDSIVSMQSTTVGTVARLLWQGGSAQGFQIITTTGQKTLYAPYTSSSHLVGTYDGTNMKIYQNGSLVSTSTPVTGTLLAHDLITIGYSGATGQVIDVNYDEIAIYNTAVSAANILDHYTLGSAGTTTSTTTKEKIILDDTGRSDYLLKDNYTTATPVGAYDGQVITLQVDATLGVVWQFRYRSAAISPFKWEFIGGPPLRAIVDTAQTRANATYAALTTAGPDLTIPLSGEYDIAIGSHARINDAVSTQIYHSYQVGSGITALDVDAAFTTSSGQFDGASVISRRRKTVTKNTVIISHYRTASGNTGQWENRWMEILPVRV